MQVHKQYETVVINTINKEFDHLLNPIFKVFESRI